MQNQPTDSSLPRDRWQAAAQGERFYFPGTPCCHGHVSRRYTSTGTCVQCATERHAKFVELRALGKARKANMEEGSAWYPVAPLMQPSPFIPERFADEPPADASVAADATATRS